MQKPHFTIASLFSGGGLADVGAVMAGYASIWGVEFDPAKPALSKVIADYYERNLKAHIIRQPVQEVDWHKLETPTLLWASPPCTRMSAANTRGRESELDMELAIAVSKAIETLLPPAFCLENVRAYRKSASLQIIRDTLNRLGYNITEHILDAADYGVPQNRIRLYLRAVRGHMPPALPPPDLRRVGWYEAIADLVPTLPESKLAPWQQTYLARVQIEEGRAYLIERAGVRSCKPKMRIDKSPCWTIRASIGTDQNGNNRNDAINALLENGRVVRLTPRALARLQTLPDWYVLPEEMKYAGPLIGNGCSCHIVQIITESLIPVLLPSKYLIGVSCVGKGADSNCDVNGCSPIESMPATDAKHETIGVESRPDSMLTTSVGGLVTQLVERRSNTMNYTAEQTDTTFQLGDRVAVVNPPLNLAKYEHKAGVVIPSPEIRPMGKDNDICVKFDKVPRGLDNPYFFKPEFLLPEEQAFKEQSPKVDAEPEYESEPAQAAIAEVVEELSKEEEKDRTRLELRVERAFYESGCALRELRDRKLYRSTHKTFEQYCRDRFGFERRHSYRLIEAAGVVENLKDFCVQFGHILPANESQCRFLSGLEQELQVQAWGELVEESGGKCPTGKAVKVKARTFQAEGDVVERIKRKGTAPPFIPYKERDAVVVTPSDPKYRQYKGWWGIVTSVMERSCHVHITLKNETLQCTPDEMEAVTPEQAKRIQEISDRVAVLARCNLDRAVWVILETINQQLEPTEIQLELLEWAEKRYGIKNYDN